MDIDMAYDLAKEAHRRFMREGGERYFEHVRAVALILADECDVTEPDIIISSLLHDTIEDTPMFGNILLPENEWRKTARYRLKKMFNHRVADTVIALTKPRIIGKKTKIKRRIQHQKYANQLLHGTPEAAIIKMADRLHNLRTLRGTSLQKQKKQIEETKKFLIPLFKKINLHTYTKYAKKFERKIRHELESLEKKK
jgi:(p)ppGpp synthase/HD superfamily hydrolase